MRRQDGILPSFLSVSSTIPPENQSLPRSRRQQNLQFLLHIVYPLCPPLSIQCPMHFPCAVWMPIAIWWGLVSVSLPLASRCSLASAMTCLPFSAGAWPLSCLHLQEAAENTLPLVPQKKVSFLSPGSPLGLGPTKTERVSQLAALALSSSGPAACPATKWWDKRCPLGWSHSADLAAPSIGCDPGTPKPIGRTRLRTDKSAASLWLPVPPDNNTPSLGIPLRQEAGQLPAGGSQPSSTR